MFFRIWTHLLLFVDSRLELLRFTCSANVLANPVLRAVGEIHTASNSICSGASTPSSALKEMRRFPETPRCLTAKVVGVGNKQRQRMEAFAVDRGQSFYNGLSSPIGHKTKAENIIRPLDNKP